MSRPHHLASFCALSSFPKETYTATVEVRIFNRLSVSLGCLLQKSCVLAVTVFWMGISNSKIPSVYLTISHCKSLKIIDMSSW
jgi:hypothetical protein